MQSYKHDSACYHVDTISPYDLSPGAFSSLYKIDVSQHHNFYVVPTMCSKTHCSPEVFWEMRLPRLQKVE